MANKYACMEGVFVDSDGDGNSYCGWHGGFSDLIKSNISNKMVCPDCGGEVARTYDGKIPLMHSGRA